MKSEELANLTPEEKRIRIAELCGLNVEKHNHQLWDIYYSVTNSMPLRIPDYLNDLNAMHEAEEVFTKSQMSDYMDNLDATTDANFEIVSMVRATAAQRADAFLLTLAK